MISAQAATEIVLNNAMSLQAESVPLSQSNGRLLMENLVADRDFPPFNRVAMDGIAIQTAAFQSGQTTFIIEGLQAAGNPQLSLKNASHAIEVMTGAVLPQNTDCVIRYEDVDLFNEQATVNLDSVTAWQNVHRQGNDRQRDTVIVEKGRIISPAEIGVAATIGKSHLLVATQPKVVIISTGDELVEVNEMPLPHQIRRSNVYTIQASLQMLGISVDLAHLIDDKEMIHQTLTHCLANYDVLILSGGVSKGKLDFIPEILEQLGVEKLFQKVLQRPGKPFWFGKTARNYIFALPGNPISSFMCTKRYFEPWLRQSLELPAFDERYAILEEDFEFKPDLQYFLQVKVYYKDNGRCYATPVEGRGSGDLANLVEADGFIELSAKRSVFEQGEVFPLYLYRGRM